MFWFSEDKGYQAFRILQFVYIVAPIVAGFDKFFNYLVNWSVYLSPLISQYTQVREQFFLSGVGVLEIIAGIGMMYAPKIFAYIISLWLLLVIINLILTGHYYDIALRDFGLLLGALALGRLAQKYDVAEVT